MSHHRSIKSQRNRNARILTSANVSVNREECGVTCMYCRDYFPNKKKKSFSFICKPCGRKAFGG